MSSCLISFKNQDDLRYLKSIVIQSCGTCTVGSKNRRGGYGKTIKKKGSRPAPEL